MIPESAYISSLVQGDIEKLRSVVCGCIDKFYLDHDPTKSLDKTYITGLITLLHETVFDFIEELKNEN